MKAERIAELIVPDDGDRLMSMRETAARLLTSPATVTALTRRGVLRGVHIGHISVKLEVCGKPTMILTVCEDEMLCVDTKDVKWHIASIRVKACR